jgi:hypothetical protein
MCWLLPLVLVWLASWSHGGQYENRRNDEFDRIEHENAMKSGQPYHFEIFVSKSQRNQVIEECAKIAEDWDKQNKLSNYGTCIARQIRELKESVNHT